MRSSEDLIHDKDARPEPHDDKEITVLNRKLVWRDGLITCEGGPPDCGQHFGGDGLGGGLGDLGHDRSWWRILAGGKTRSLSHDQASKFRSVAALANYLALDRPDMQVAVSVLCQKMDQPTAGIWPQVKRVERYLKKYPVLLYEFWEDGEDLESEGVL